MLAGWLGACILPKHYFRGDEAAAGWIWAAGWSWAASAVKLYFLFDEAGWDLKGFCREDLFS